MDIRDCESVRNETMERPGVQDALPTSARSEENGSSDQKEEMENQHGRNLQNDEGEEQTIKIGFWNMNGGISKKDSQFWEFIEQLDIIGLIETWVTEEEWKKQKDTLPETFNWKCHYAVKDKIKGRASGGIITGVKKWINEEETVKGTKNICETKIIIENEKWTIITVYSQDMNETRDDIQRITERLGGEKLVIGGDFNARIGPKRDEGETGERRSKDRCLNTKGKILIEMIEENCWYILNGNTEGDREGEFTFIGSQNKEENSKDEQGDSPSRKSVIDYGIVNSEVRQRVKKFTVENRSGSDHLPIVIELYKYAASENQKAEEEKMENQVEKSRIDLEKLKINEMIDDPTQKIMKARNEIGESSRESYIETKEEIQSLTNDTASLQEEKGLIPETQAGVRSRASATEYIRDIASSDLQEKGSTLQVFYANLKASFDNVKGKTLSQMMKEKGISIADLEEYVKEEQPGVVAIGNPKKRTASYKDGIVLAAKTAMELQGMKDRLKNYLKEKGIILNEEKSKADVIKGRVRKEKTNENVGKKK